MATLELTLNRLNYDEKRTIGELYANGAFECYTLEDPVRSGPKIDGVTAIPAGRYQVEMTLSGRAQRGTLWTPDPNHRLPELKGVPGFMAIRIHSGNTAENTEGCILVGLDLVDMDASDPGPEAVGRSRDALRKLISKIVEVDGCWITIADIQGAVV